MNIRKFLNQDAVYWPPVGKDHYGNVTYGAPSDRKVRIVVKTTTRSTPVSDIVLPDATVLTADWMEPTGMIALGTVAELESDDSPQNNGGIVIRTVLPFVGRGGNTLGWELTTTAQFTLGRAGSMR